MINTDNYHDILDYRQYCERTKQNTKGTLALRWTQLRHLLEWADEIPLARGATIDPTFPEYLTTAKNGRTKGENLAYKTQIDICKTVQAFYRWAKTELRGYRRVNLAWVEGLRPKRQGKGKQQPKAWKIEDMHRIAACVPPTLTLERVQAAIVLMFLSGMRVGAFVTLPIKAVDLEANEIHQIPAWGVHTKNSKQATTSLLQIPDLLGVVRRWDEKVRAVLSPGDMWFAHLKSDGSGFRQGMPTTDTRTSRVRKDMRKLCELVGVEYKSPHALRHGFALYGKIMARDIGDLKAISSTLMHESLTITDQIYGIFDVEQVKERLAKLGQENSADVGQSALIEQLAAVRQMLEELVDQNRSKMG